MTLASNIRNKIITSPKAKPSDMVIYILQGENQTIKKLWNGFKRKVFLKDF
jgi:hypothetical protein